MAHYAVVDADGNAVSFGSEVASDSELAERGLTKVKLSREPDFLLDHVDLASGKVRRMTAAELDERDPSRVRGRAREELKTTAKKSGATLEQKVDYLIALLEG